MTLQSVIKPLNITKPDGNYELNFENHLNAYVPILQHISTLYKSWLNILSLNSNTLPDTFTEKIQECKKLADKPEYETYEKPSGKRIVLTENLTTVEIKNMFLFLYRSYFTLKVNLLKENIPKMTDIKQQIEHKLHILEKFEYGSRRKCAI